MSEKKEKPKWVYVYEIEAQHGFNYDSKRHKLLSRENMGKYYVWQIFDHRTRKVEKWIAGRYIGKLTEEDLSRVKKGEFTLTEAIELRKLLPPEIPLPSKEKPSKEEKKQITPEEFIKRIEDALADILPLMEKYETGELNSLTIYAPKEAELIHGKDHINLWLVNPLDEHINVTLTLKAPKGIVLSDNFSEPKNTLTLDLNLSPKSFMLKSITVESQSDKFKEGEITCTVKANGSEKSFTIEVRVWESKA